MKNESPGTENSLDLKCINDLMDYSFYVPDYQRGYRWTHTQVEALLNDIWKFRNESQDKKREVFYCLQPIVVANGDKGWIVIDGQQRLTTIHLILTFLKDVLQYRKTTNYKLSYQTRPDSETFLNDIDLSRESENIDYYHMCQAYRTINSWFESKPENARINFVTTLLNSDEEGKNVKVIWYKVEDDDSIEHIDIFTRLNDGKIPLTNAELIKALFLQRGNFDESIASLKQIQIATEWDEIERKLQHDEFWYFIYNRSNLLTYENRIEYIFDLMYKRTRDQEYYYTLYKFLTEAEASKSTQGQIDIDDLWLAIKRYFQVFEDWFNNRELYHLVGFLITSGESINTLKQATENKTKKDLVTDLKLRIRKLVQCNIDDLEYGEKKIRPILLLFNLQTLLINSGADVRFPFYRYKKGNWDIEHIRSQTDKRIAGKYRLDWIKDLIVYFIGLDIQEFTLGTYTEKVERRNLYETLGLESKVCEFVEKLLSMYLDEISDDEAFDQLRLVISEHFKEGEDGFDNKDAIGNLALLDEKTNRSYKNALFPIKRNQIIDNDKTGMFVPICTKNVFLKYYSKKLGEVMYWKNEDARSYTDEIKNMLKDFLTDER